MNGQGIRQDYVQAHKWLSLAAARFSALEVATLVLFVEHYDVS